MSFKKIATFLKPDCFCKKVSDIEIEKLTRSGIKGLILDVDNTLISRKSLYLSKDVFGWVNRAQNYFKIIILSNNSESKILRVAKPLNIQYIPWTLKPLTFFYKLALLRLELNANEVCVIGDQVFTDILGGKLIGAKAIYVEPINEKEDSGWTRFVRLFEKKLLKKWKVEI